MIIESVVAFLLIAAASTLIYYLGRRAAPKTAQSEAACSVYACGEKISYPKLRVNVSLYKYLIYFVILDSSVLLIAFASFMGQVTNTPMILLYLLLMLASGFLLMEGGEKSD
jgi:NADH:ubiquinone oxidoreductase subunit 3 (subunit A)